MDDSGSMGHDRNCITRGFSSLSPFEVQKKCYEDFCSSRQGSGDLKSVIMFNFKAR